MKTRAITLKTAKKKSGTLSRAKVRKAVKAALASTTPAKSVKTVFVTADTTSKK